MEKNEPTKPAEVRRDEPRIGATMLRDYAGVMVCSVTVLSFISIGFIMMFIKVAMNSDVSPPGEWLAAMLSLASTALGFLAGQRSGAMGSKKSDERKSICPYAAPDR